MFEGLPYFFDSYLGLFRTPELFGCIDKEYKNSEMEAREQDSSMGTDREGYVHVQGNEEGGIK